LNSFSSKDLETLIAGKKDVNIEMLKRHTVYSGSLNENSDLIKNFWQVLNSFKPNEKLKFVKFCWG
jgi:other hect domain ubiquitin protein ligase E3